MTQNTPENPIYLGFASQKGGVGKSSLAEALASILYYEKGIPLLVVDCDGTQESFYKLRERERALIEDSKELSDQMKAHFTRFGKPAYPIIRSRPIRAIGDTETFLQKTDKTAALVIFDFPGHAGAEELLELSIEMDYLISPIEADPQSLASGLLTHRLSATSASASATPAFATCFSCGTRSTAVPIWPLSIIIPDMPRMNP